MKNLVKKSLLLSLVASSLMAGSWEDVLSGIDKDQGIVDDGNLQTNLSLYNSTISYLINNNDGETGNFSGSDTGRIIITSSDGTVLDSGVITSDAMEDWAKENASEIMSSVFGDDPSESMGGQNNAVVTSYTILDTITTIEDNSKLNKKSTLKNQTASQSISMLGSEKFIIKDQNKDIKGSNTVVSFSSVSPSANSAGILINYKSSSADDNLDSKTKNLLLTPYYKIDGSIDEKLNIPVVLSLSANIVYLKSNIFEDGVGYFEYGGGIGVLPTYKMTDNLTMKLNIGYSYLKKYIPESYVPEDAQWLSDAINDLEALQVASYGLGAKYNIEKNWIILADILQTKHLQTQTIQQGREKATYYAVSSSYSWSDWSLRLGYKTVQDLKDYEEDAYLVSFSYSW